LERNREGEKKKEINYRGRKCLSEWKVHGIGKGGGCRGAKWGEGWRGGVR